MSSKTDPVLVGTVIRAHGLAGELLIFTHSDAAGRWRPGQVVSAGDRDLTVAKSRGTDQGLLVRFVEISDRTAAESLGKADLFIGSAARRALDPDEYWPDELIGLEVRDEHGTVLGEVADVDDSTSQARLLVRTGRGTYPVPLVSELVPVVDVGHGHVVIRSVPGLLED